MHRAWALTIAFLAAAQLAATHESTDDWPNQSEHPSSAQPIQLDRFDSLRRDRIDTPIVMS